MKDLAHLQGKIYDQLYSSEALAQPQDIRTTRARSLAAELEVHKSREGTNEVWQPKYQLPLASPRCTPIILEITY